MMQWLLRGYGRPKHDEYVELTVRDIAELPWPNLDREQWQALGAAARRIRNALNEKTAVARSLGYRAERHALDHLVMDIYGASQRLRDVIDIELIHVY